MLEKLNAKKAELEATIEGYNAEIAKMQAEIAKVQGKIAVVDELIAEEVAIAPKTVHFGNGIGSYRPEPTNGNGFVL